MMGLPPFGSVARMNEALMANEQVASRKGLGADVAYKWFLLSVSSTDVPLVCAAARSQMLELPDVPLEVLESCEEALTVRTWQCLGLGGLGLSLDTACGRCMGFHSLPRRGVFGESVCLLGVGSSSKEGVGPARDIDFDCGALASCSWHCVTASNLPMHNSALFCSHRMSLHKRLTEILFVALRRSALRALVLLQEMNGGASRVLQHLFTLLLSNFSWTLQGERRSNMHIVKRTSRYEHSNLG